MTRLGYTRYVAQGGDWGNAVTEQMALQLPKWHGREMKKEMGVHTATCPPLCRDEISKLLPGDGPAPANLSARHDEEIRLRPAR